MNVVTKLDVIALLTSDALVGEKNVVVLGCQPPGTSLQLCYVAKS